MPKSGPFSKKLRKHLRVILEEIAAGGEGRPTDTALVAELQYKVQRREAGAASGLGAL